MGYLLHALTIVFVVLRLANVIDWSWWLVVSPSLALLVLWAILISGLVALLGSSK